MRHAPFIVGIALIAATALSGCLGDEQTAQNAANNSSTDREPTLNMPSGSSIDVTLATALTSETASVGSSWNGSVRNAVVIDGRTVIPAGSSVTGTVTSAKPAQKGDRAMLDLAMTSVTINGRSHRIRAGMESVVAGSTRARNLGAIAGSVAGGALIGKAVSGTGKGALIGGIVGGGVATGVVAGSDGYQVVLKSGTSLTFTTSEAIAVRL